MKNLKNQFDELVAKCLTSGNEIAIDQAEFYKNPEDYAKNKGGGEEFLEYMNFNNNNTDNLKDAILKMKSALAYTAQEVQKFVLIKNK